MQKFPVKRSATVEVPVSNVNANTFHFTDNETTLDRIRITGIEVHTEAVSKTFTGKTVVPDAVQKRAFLTINDRNSKSFLKRIPLESFFNNSKIFREELDRLEMDLRKSFIEINDRTGLTTDMAFLITIFYEDVV
ncbi:MAG TPA: hypothetical protein PKE63_02915 [Lacibacter sp.]|nr:hypothetical protein [Lacibacter sp.]HMO89562.1 hypothetical protein [Lacibacter sp.]HMP86197.1 hypothetical protein [Lacibacter sp.]